MRPHRSLAEFHHLRNLAVIELLDEVQPRNDALHLRQRLDRCIDARTELVCNRRQIGLIPSLRRLRFAQLFVTEPASMLHDVEREIRHDAKDPWSERLAGTEAADRLIRLHECFLREVFRIMRTPHDSPRNRRHSFQVF